MASFTSKARVHARVSWYSKYRMILLSFLLLVAALLLGVNTNDVSFPHKISNIQAPNPIDGDYGGPLRPQIHFSPPKGFMNDPNGLFKDDDGTYHLYYQYNPTGLVAGNQHWGHATSPDLYRWINQPIAIAPGDPSQGIFTGSAVVDRNNTSSFFPNQTNGVVAMYTLHTPSSQVQEIAYSTDGGYTFTKYIENPVIDVGSNEFRDPKVFWHGPTSKWVVVIAYAQDYVVGIWTSPNLRQWTHASNFTHQGLLGLQYECPNLVPVPMLKDGSGTSMDELLSPNNFMPEPVWLMYISLNPGAPLGGSISQYFPGSFNGTHFVALDGATRLSDFAKDNYAGQFFSEIPGDQPQISIAWASNWQYTDSVPTDVEGFRSVMALPRLHVLANTSRTPYGLWSVPKSLSDLYSTSYPLAKSSNMANGTVSLNYGRKSPSGALLVDIVARALPHRTSGSFNFTFSSSKTNDSVAGGVLLAGDPTVFLDRSNVHGFANPFLTGQFSVTHPLDPRTRQLGVRLVIDRSIIEVFIDGGVRSGTAVLYPEAEFDTVWLGSEGLADGVTIEVEMWGLKSGWIS